jgi:3-methyladenine DNA glycosylase AlkD
MIMNNFHEELLAELKKHAGKGTTHSANDSYLSSGHYYYSVSVPVKRKIALQWVKVHKNIEVAELLSLLQSLFRGESYEEKTMAGILLGYLPNQRKEINPELLDVWLANLVGWAEIDTLCQGTYSAKEILYQWETWKNLLIKFSKDTDISKRRAALVLLTGPVANSDNKTLEKLAFEVIDTLKAEKDILITKAISWLLRSLVKFHKTDVRIYVETNKDLLPKIAVRETMRKIETGRK